jgi:hypothetical protein
MNMIAGGNNGARSVTSPTLDSFAQLGELNHALTPAIPGQIRAKWIETARTSADPAMQALYRELVTFAGGRTDDAALNQVIDRFQAIKNATTASEVQAAERG